MKRSKQQIPEVQDAAPQPLPEADVLLLKNDLEQIVADAGSGVLARRLVAQEIRYCLWPNQFDDGKKHAAPGAENDPAAEPFPWNGASDARLRMADKATERMVKIVLAAVMRGQPKFVGIDMPSGGWAAQLQMLLTWVLQNKMGPTYRREMKKLLQYIFGDAPAGAVMGVYWDQATGLEMKTLSVDELIEMAMQSLQEMQAQTAGGASPAAAAAPEVAGTPAGESAAAADSMLRDLIADPERAELAVLLLRKYFKWLQPARARKVLAELRAGGEAKFPVPYLKRNEPRMTAHRLFEDIWFRVDATDFQRLSSYYIREWLYEAEVREKAVTEEWSQAFIDEVLKHEGESAFPTVIRQAVNDIAVQPADPDGHRGQYEILRAYYQTVNEDGMMGIFTTVLHHAVKFAGVERQLLDYAHGKLPGVYFSREVLTGRLTDSRPLPEVLMSFQLGLKKLHDLFLDHAEISTIGPVFVPMNRPPVRLRIRPLAQIKRSRQTDYEMMTGFGTPTTNLEARKEIQRMADDVAGNYNAELPRENADLDRQDAADDFACSLGEVFWMLIQLCQQYLTDDELALILNKPGFAGLRRGEPGGEGPPTRADIQGRFRVTVAINVRDLLDQEYVMKKLEIVCKYLLPADTLGVIERDKLINYGMRILDPNLADDTIRPLESANQAEQDDEDANMAKIMAGVEPAMSQPNDGKNHQLRMQRLLQWPQANPVMAQRLRTQKDSLAIYQARLANLKQMLVQDQNKLIGRTGERPGLEQLRADVAGQGGG